MDFDKIKRGIKSYLVLLQVVGSIFYLINLISRFVYIKIFFKHITTVDLIQSKKNFLVLLQKLQFAVKSLLLTLKKNKKQKICLESLTFTIK